MRGKTLSWCIAFCWIWGERVLFLWYWYANANPWGKTSSFLPYLCWNEWVGLMISGYYFSYFALLQIWMSQRRGRMEPKAWCALKSLGGGGEPGSMFPTEILPSASFQLPHGAWWIRSGRHTGRKRWNHNVNDSLSHRCRQWEERMWKTLICFITFISVSMFFFLRDFAGLEKKLSLWKHLYSRLRK